MDPMTIATTTMALAKVCSQVVMLCNNLAYRVQGMRRTLIALRTETSAYQTSLHLIQDLLLDQTGDLASLLSNNKEWAESFDTALSACGVMISILVTELQKAMDTASSNSIQYILNEQDLKDLIGELRGQQGGVQLLVQTLQLKSTAEIHRLLTEKQDVLRNVKQQTASLSEHWGMRPIRSTGLASDTFSLLSVDVDDKQFDFDEEISRMGPYRRAFRAQVELHRQNDFHVTPNLIDDDLLDLSIEALQPGPWTEELQREFSKDQDSGTDTILPRSEINELVPSPNLDSETGETGETEETEETKETEETEETEETDEIEKTEETETGLGIAAAFVETELSIDNKSPSISTTENEEIGSTENLALRAFEYSPEDIPPSTKQASETSESMKFKDFDHAELYPSPQSSPVLPNHEPAKDELASMVPFDFQVVGSKLIPFKPKGADLEKMKHETPLHYAAFIGAPITEMLNSLSARKLKSWLDNPNYEHSVLEFAARCGNFENLQVIMSKTGFSLLGKREWDKAPRNASLTALHWAAALGHVEVVKLLLTIYKAAHPCRLRCRLMNGEVVVFKGWTALSLATFFGHVKVVEAILEANPLTIDPLTDSGYGLLISPLFAAISSIQYLLIYNTFAGFQNLLGTRDLLKVGSYRESDAYLWLSDRNQKNDILGPSLEHRLDILELLFRRKGQHKFNINENDGAGFSLIHVAACGSQPEIMRKLLELGASLTRKNPSLSDRLAGHLRGQLRHQTASPLHLAAFWNRPDLMEVLLQGGASANVLDYRNRTPLHYAAAMGCEDSTELLCSVQANLNLLSTNFRPHTPLTYAFIFQRWNCAKILIKAGSDLASKIYPHHSSEEPVNSVLHYVLEFGDESMLIPLEILLKSGISPHILNRFGKSSLEVLASKPWNKYVNEAMILLIRYGASPNRRMKGWQIRGGTLLQQVICTNVGRDTTPGIEDILKSTLAMGADPKLRNSDGLNASELLNVVYMDLLGKKPQRKDLRKEVRENGPARDKAREDLNKVLALLSKQVPPKN